MLEESSGSNTQHLKMVYQTIHHSSYHPPPQQNQQRSNIRSVVALTYPNQLDTPGIRPKRSWTRQ
jgi:phosphoserine aminotransferase